MRLPNGWSDQVDEGLLPGLDELGRRAREWYGYGLLKWLVTKRSKGTPMTGESRRRTSSLPGGGEGMGLVSCTHRRLILGRSI